MIQKTTNTRMKNLVINDICVQKKGYSVFLLFKGRLVFFFFFLCYLLFMVLGFHSFNYSLLLS